MPPRQPYNPRPNVLTEQHLSPTQIAKAWCVSVDYVRRRFKWEPGTIRLGRTMRIPLSVAERVHRQAARVSIEGPIRFSRYRLMVTKSGSLEPRLLPSKHAPRPNPATFPVDPNEPCFTPSELAKAWHVSPDFIRRRFRYEPDTLQLKRAIRIPRSVAARVYEVSVLPNGTMRPAPRS